MAGPTSPQFVALLVYAGIVAVATFASGQAYRRIWTGYRRDGVTPTGFGALLAPAMVGAALCWGVKEPLLVALVVVTGATAVYWLDDVRHLSARLRIAISFLSGAGIAFALLLGDFGGSVALLPLVLAAGVACVVLTNMVNFYDGADLNLGTFIALTAAMILLFTPRHSDWVAIAIGALAFIVPFGIINSRPRSLYLGDSGSFAFAGVLTAMAVAFADDFASVAPEAAIPAALPMLDVAYVFGVRIYEKHDMLTRNYLHLYQRLNRRHAGFGYLLPQITNVALCLVATAALEQMGCGRIIAVIIAMIVVTVIFYALCRVTFLAGPPEAPLYETSR